MCRLLGYALAGENVSLQDVLGQRSVEDYRSLSEIHHDGWGCSQLSAYGEAGHQADVNPLAGKTGTRLYKTTVEADEDPVFEKLSQNPARGALWHLRLASSHLPLIVENQQPFFSNGLSFTHNGDISDDQGRNIITRADDVVDEKVFLATGGRSDSAVFFAVILDFMGFGFSLEEAVPQAVRQLRQQYPKSSYNCMVQSRDKLVVVCASGRDEVSPRIVEIYGHYGRSHQAVNYRAIRYRPVLDAAGNKVGVVAASSGISQRDEDGWQALPNDHMLVASNRTGAYRVQAL